MIDETDELPYAGDLDLREQWAAFRPTSSFTGRREFLLHLKGIVSDPDTINDIAFCGDCGDPEWADEMFTTGTGERICETCAGNWTTCAQCEELFPPEHMTRTLDEERVCESCRLGHYTWCENCDGYYNDEDADAHDHNDYYNCCVSPQLTFAVRNDGHGPLANDTQTTVTLPAGVISREGINAIRSHLHDYGVSLGTWDLEVLGDEWQTTAGNFTKRLSHRVYKMHEVKLSPVVLSQVGSIASDHSKQVNVTVEFTRDLNQGPEYFYHEGSCWWGTSYGESRCAFKTNGGFGMRTFRGSHVSGRAWVMPLRRDLSGHLAPTFDTLTPDAFMVFNGYGDLSGYDAPRVLAQMAGWTYRKVSFECSPMYVNAGGYLVAPEDIVREHGDVSLRVAMHANLFETEQKEAVNVA